jgi:hypothetical protein
MTRAEAEYEAYVKLATSRGWPILPRDYGTPPKVFGMNYHGSSRKRKNDIRRKRMAKNN